MSQPRAVVVGPDADGLGAALAAAGADLRRVEAVPTGGALDDAGIDDADLYVLTDVDEASTVAVVRERNPDVRVVAYTPDSLPEFARGQADLAVDPALLDAVTVAEELLDGVRAGPDGD